MPIVYGKDKCRQKYVHGGTVGSVITSLLTSAGPRLLKKLPKAAFKILAPIVLSAISPLIMHGVERIKGARNNILDLARDTVVSGTDSILDGGVDKLLTAATKKPKAAPTGSGLRPLGMPGRGLVVPKEMKKMLNARSEMILKNL